MFLLDMNVNAITGIALLLLGTISLSLLRRTWFSDSSRLPPGPRRTWLVGNLFDIPTKYLWLAFTEWRKEYGDIISIQALGRTIVVLNTLESVNDLLDKRGNVYSDRPQLTMAGDIVGTNRTLPMLQYGAAWREQRKLIQTALGTEAVNNYIPYQEDVALIYLETLLEKPQNFISELRLASGRFLMAMTYGIYIKSYDDEYIAEAEAVVRFVERSIVPGTFMVDLIPALNYLPNVFGLLSFKTEGLKHRRLFEQMERGAFEQVKRDLAAGKASPSFTSELLSREDAVFDEDLIKVTAATLYAAGGDTSFMTVQVFILAMILFPEKQRKAQEEIDRVVGSDRFPTIDDRATLPYVGALINEVMRWHPVAPTGLAHQSSQDDHYKGFLIPAETFMMPNIWAISHEETIYESPDDFIPERFLNADGPRPIDPQAYTFGFGRRVCPGRHLANNSVYIFITSILSTFRICKPLDAHGNEIHIHPAFAGGLLSHPEPFECRFVPRSTKAVDLIRNSRKRSDIM